MISMRRKLLLGCFVLFVLVSVVQFQKTRLLTWYYLRELARADENHRQTWMTAHQQRSVPNGTPDAQYYFAMPPAAKVTSRWSLSPFILGHSAEEPPNAGQHVPNADALAASLRAV